MAGWPIPQHFQLVSEAKDENARLDTVFLKHMKDVRGVFIESSIATLLLLVIDTQLQAYIWLY